MAGFPIPTLPDPAKIAECKNSPGCVDALGVYYDKAKAFHDACTAFKKQASTLQTTITSTQNLISAQNVYINGLSGQIASISSQISALTSTLNGLLTQHVIAVGLAVVSFIVAAGFTVAAIFVNPKHAIVAAAAVASGLYWAKVASDLQKQIDDIKKQLEELTKALQALQQQLADATNLVANQIKTLQGLQTSLTSADRSAVDQAIDALKKAITELVAKCPPLCRGIYLSPSDYTPTCP